MGRCITPHPFSPPPPPPDLWLAWQAYMIVGTQLIWIKQNVPISFIAFQLLFCSNLDRITVPIKFGAQVRSHEDKYKHVMLSKRRGILHLLNGVRSLSTNITNKNKAEELMNSKQVPQDREATLYIHWPYCQKRCHYCNFNKYISQNVDHKKMKKCLVRETKTLLSMSSVERVKSIFFGGGTPSLAEPATISAIVDCVSDAVAMAPDAEVSMEGNPTSAEWFRLSEFKTAGKLFHFLMVIGICH